MKSNWQKIKLENENIFNLQSGLWSGKTNDLIKIQVLRNTNFNNDGTLSFDDVATLNVEKRQFKDRELQKGDILLERSGGGPAQPVGRVVYFNNKEKGYSFSNFTSRIRVINKDLVDSKYLLSYLLYFYKINGTEGLQARTTGIRNLNFTEYKKIEILCPTKPIQLKIVKVLDSIQAEIGKQKEIIEKTKELKKSLMKKLFSQGTRGEKLKQTKIGKVPVSWEVIRLGSVCQKPQYGFTASGSRDKKIGPKYIRITDIQDDKIDWQNVPYCKCKKPDNYLLKDGDILVARIGATTGKTVLFNYNEEAVFASYLMRIRPNLESLNPVYLNYFFQTNYYWDQINLQKGGRLKGGINVPVLQSLILQLPDIKEQNEIISIFQKVDAKIESAQKQKKLYEELFNNSLNKLMTQEIEVENINI